MKPERIRALLECYLTPLPDGIEYKIQKYIALLGKWGAKMPLTSIRDPEEIVCFHFGESIFALSEGDIRNGRLADVGSGAGFPGLAIKLVNPSLPISLIEPNRKKCAFLNEVIRSLELENTRVLSSNFKSSGIEPRSVSYITSRALGKSDLLLDWAHSKLKQEGSALLWVGGDDLKPIQSKSGWDWAAPALIPGTRQRFLLRGSKVS